MAHGWTLDTTPGSNPVDGDPDYVVVASNYYRRIAEAVVDSVTALRNATDIHNVKSEAVDEFRELAEEMAGKISEIDSRYEVVSDQLAIYAQEFREAQREARNAIRMIRGTAEDVARVENQIEYNERMLHDPTQPSGNIASYQQALDSAQQERNELGYAIGRWYDTIDAAVEQRANAAQRAANAIREAIEGSALNDSFWDDFQQFVGQMVDLWLDYVEFWLDVLGGLDALLDILSMIVTILAIVSIFVAPGLFVALMALSKVLTALSIAVKATRFAMTAVLATAGRASMQDVISTGFAALTAVGAKFGGDKIGKMLNNSTWANNLSSRVAGEVADLPFVRQAAAEAATELVRDEIVQGVISGTGDILGDLASGESVDLVDLFNPFPDFGAPGEHFAAVGESFDAMVATGGDLLSSFDTSAMGMVDDVTSFITDPPSIEVNIDVTIDFGGGAQLAGQGR